MIHFKNISGFSSYRFNVEIRSNLAAIRFDIPSTVCQVLKINEQNAVRYNENEFTYEGKLTNRPNDDLVDLGKYKVREERQNPVRYDRK